MPDVTEHSTAEAPKLEIPAEKLPRHIAIIMDGNGRWAEQRDLPRVEGHRAGAASVRAVMTECGRLGIPYLTLFSFSIENWKRPESEVSALMQLLLYHLQKERDELLENNVQLRHLGRREGLPADVLTKLDETIELTRQCTGLTLGLALNYGSRTEITDAVHAIARKVQTGELEPEAIDQQTIDEHLYTAGMPDPDLLIRTAGQMRISNYLLWQISYAELHVADAYWPDFGAEQLHKALRDFAGRQRRFGAVDSV